MELVLGLGSIFTDWFSSLYEMLFNPQKRVSIYYLVSATLVALFWFYKPTNRSWPRLREQWLNPTYWWSSSAKLDYQLLILNQLLMLLLKPFMLGKLAVATLIYYTMADWFMPIRVAWSGAAWAIPIAYTLVLFVVDDASRYWVHRLMHRVPVLWAFHRLHHSAETLTPFTVLRTHPVESLLFGLRSVLVQGFVTGVFVYLFGKQVSLWQVLGANGFIFIFNLLGANLRHSHVPLSYGKNIEKWLLSPAQHQLHHSVEVQHYDKNFGVVLAVWDRWGNTLCTYVSNQSLRFGVMDTHGAHNNLKQAYLQPFVQLVKTLIAPLERVFGKS